MKIRLLIDVLVDKAHGLKAGRVFEVLSENDMAYKMRDDQDSVWVMGDAGEKVKIWDSEFEIVDPTNVDKEVKDE